MSFFLKILLLCVCSFSLRFNLETVVESKQKAQDIESEPLATQTERPQTVKAAPITSNYGSRACAYRPTPATASRFRSREEDCSSNFLGPDCFLSIIEAAKLTLENQKQIFISYENIEAQAGLARQKAQPFDPLATAQYQRNTTRLSQFTSPPPKKTKLSTFESQFNASLSKLTRPGTSFLATVELDNIRTKLLPGPVFGKSAPYTLFFQVTQPLLRNFIYGFNTMAEKSQQLQVSVAWYSAIYQVSTSLFTTVSDYWAFVAAKETITIHEQAIEQYTSLMGKAKNLIEAQILAPSDIYQIQAQLAVENANLALAQDLVVTTLETLKFDMGIGDQCIGCENDLKTEDYPPMQQAKYTGNDSCDYLMGKSKSFYKNRADIIASIINEEAVELLVIGSRNLALPQLDVFGSYNYNRNNISTNPPPSKSNSRQEETVVGVIFSYPLQNDYALGLLQQQKALKNIASLQTKLLQEQMSANFFQLWENHFLLIEAIKEATESVEYYTTVVKNELTKLDAGFSSVFEIITLQENLTQNQLLLNQIYMEYAQNIIQYRYVTGTLLKIDDPYFGFEVEPLTQWPNLL